MNTLCVLAALTPLTPPLLLARELAASNTYKPNVYRVVALLSILSPLPLALCSLARLREALAYSAVALAIGYAVLAVMILRIERQSSGSLTVEGSSARLGARLLSGSRMLAFSIAAFGRVYISSSLARHLPPSVVCSVTAHEHGHLKLFEPLPPQLWYPLSVLPAALAFYTVTLEAVEHMAVSTIAWALLSYAGLAGAWIAYSWSWELYADSYAARICGPEAALEALSATAAAHPCRKGLAGILADMAKSLKPVRVVGVSISNPHPPPCLRALFAWQLALIESHNSRPTHSL